MAKLLEQDIEASTFTNSNPVDVLAPYIDLKTSTVDGLVRKIIEDYYQKNVFEGLQEFTGQILRVEEDRKKFQESKLDSLGLSINREIYKRYKVRVFNIDSKPAPKTFDLTPEDVSLIDTYNDFTYIPYSFGNHEPMNVGDFVVVNFGNFKTKSDGRILFKFSGASHAQATVGSSEKKETVSPKKVFEEKKPEVKVKKTEPPPPPPVVESPPPPPPPKSAEYVREKDRSLQQIGKYKRASDEGWQYLKDVFFEATTNSQIWSSYKRHIENMNNDINDRKYPSTYEFKEAEIKIDFENLTPENKKNYRRASYSFKQEAGDDGIYIRAFLDLIAWRETSLDYGYDIPVGRIEHPEDYNQPGKIKFRIKQFGKFPYRQNALSDRYTEEWTKKQLVDEENKPVFDKEKKPVLVNDQFQKSSSDGSSAAGRYQFVWGVYKKQFSKDDFKPETQDKNAVLGWILGTPSQLAQNLKEDTEESFRKVLIDKRAGKQSWESLPYHDNKINYITYFDDKKQQHNILYTEKIVKYVFKLLLEDQKKIQNNQDPIQTSSSLAKNAIKILFENDENIKNIQDLINDGIKRYDQSLTTAKYGGSLLKKDYLDVPSKEEREKKMQEYTEKQKKAFENLISKKEDLKRENQKFDNLLRAGSSDARSQRVLVQDASKKVQEAEEKFKETLNVPPPAQTSVPKPTDSKPVATKATPGRGKK